MLDLCWTIEKKHDKYIYLFFINVRDEGGKEKKKEKKRFTYHEVAYSTKTLAAFEIAKRASFETLTPSGI